MNSPYAYSPHELHNRLCRRAFLSRGALGLGTAALGVLSGGGVRGEAPSPASTQFPPPRGILQAYHVPPKVKRVIFLYMSGGPSQFETFDYKPKLAEMDGQPMPATYTAGMPIAQLQGEKLVCLGPRLKFARHGRSGQEISQTLPHIATIADDMCIVRSMQTDQINHDPAHMVMNTGSGLGGRPSMGSWVLYGLGSEADNLPGFVVMTSEGGRSPQPLSVRQWGSGFLSNRLTGIQFRSKGEAVDYISNPAGVSATRQQEVVQAVNQLNRLRNREAPDPEIETRISQYELAFRMQMSIPGLTDFSDEPKHITEMYGANSLDGSFAGNCLLARRMAERGVRFIQLYHRGWDHHNDLLKFMAISSGMCDRPSAALVKDLKRRGMLDETLIIWGGEFGRTPMAQNNKGDTGRDHHIKGFSMWLAGGGIRPGITHGETDELGYNAVKDVVHVNDLHATMLHLLGIDHLRLTFRTQGRDYRLTDVGGRVVREILT